MSLHCIHPNKSHKAIAEVFWNNAEHLFSEEMLPNYDFSSLPPKWKTKEVTEESFGVYLDFVKKSEDLVTSDDESSFCRVTKY